MLRYNLFIAWFNFSSRILEAAAEPSSGDLLREFQRLKQKPTDDTKY